MAWPGNTTGHKEWSLVQNNDGCSLLQIKAACGEQPPAFIAAELRLSATTPVLLCSLNSLKTLSL